MTGQRFNETLGTENISVFAEVYSGRRNSWVCLLVCLKLYFFICWLGKQTHVQNRQNLKTLLYCFPESTVSYKISNIKSLTVRFHLLRRTQDLLCSLELRYAPKLSCFGGRKIQEAILKIQTSGKKNCEKWVSPHRAL